MPVRTEIFRALYGAWRLLLLDRNGMNHFNLSITGFRRSFLAAVIVAPAYFATIDTGGVNPGGYGNVVPDGLIMIRALQYVAGWVAFPIIMVFVAMLMEWTDRYIPYIIAYNWSSVIMITVMLPVTLVAEAVRPEHPSFTLIDALYYMAFMFTLFYGWFVAQTALRIGPFMAIAIVLLDLIIGFTISIGGSVLLLGAGSAVQPV